MFIESSLRNLGLLHDVVTVIGSLVPPIHYFDDEARLLHLVSRLPHGQLLSRWRRQFGLPAPEIDLG